jgi:prophage antirepressor-like protein
MNTNVVKFDFDGRAVRTVTIDGNPWFVAADVCRCLGFSLSAGTRIHLRSKRFSSDEMRLVTRHDLPILFIGTFEPSATIISESAVYKLIMRSDKPEARLFQDWVTRIVLPSIRKNGGYVMGQEKVASGELSMHEMTLRVIDFHQNLTEQLKADVARLEAEKEQAQPKVEFYDGYVEADGTMTITQVAKLLNIPPRTFGQQLITDGVLYRKGEYGRMIPHSRQMKTGRFIVKTYRNPYGVAVVQTRFTSKGVTWAGRRYGIPQAFDFNTRVCAE